MDWFLYDNGLRLERDKQKTPVINRYLKAAFRYLLRYLFTVKFFHNHCFTVFSYKTNNKLERGYNRLQGNIFLLVFSNYYGSIIKLKQIYKSLRRDVQKIVLCYVKLLHRY